MPGVPEILSEPGSFAWTVLYERHPALINQVADAYPYGPAERNRLGALLDEILAGTVLPLPEDAHGKAAWDAMGRGYLGRAWQEIPFLWAESYFYAKLLHAVGYWSGDTWHGIDPFEFLKAAELRTAALTSDLRALDGLALLPERERTAVLLRAALWGNRADVGFRIGVAARLARRDDPSDGGQPAEQRGDAGPDAAVIADDSAVLLDALHSGRIRRLCVISDNAGRELVSDLILVDHLLQSGVVAEVELHVKPHPYYVSDATPADVVATLRRLGEPGPAGEIIAAQISGRLREACHDGRVGIGAHAFYCAPYAFDAMPDDLRARLASCDLVLAKGDLNYRRLVGDRRWPPTTPFASTVAYFPAPLAALRTLKSDVVVGLDPATVAALDASGQRWRIDGTHGLIQTRL